LYFAVDPPFRERGSDCVKKMGRIHGGRNVVVIRSFAEYVVIMFLVIQTVLYYRDHLLITDCQSLGNSHYDLTE
jgi:hypothetical protein